mgnify:CR=1 FL=1
MREPKRRGPNYAFYIFLFVGVFIGHVIGRLIFGGG